MDAMATDTARGRRGGGGTMISPVWVLAAGFVALLALNVPVAVAICLATWLAAVVAIGSPEIAAAALAERMATGVGSFSLLAIPFFILSGLLMARGGVAQRLMDLAAALVGRFPAGLAQVNVMSCMLFGSVSGSATAAVSSIGGFLVPEMERRGYRRETGVALTVTGATTGLLIPPSNIMIVYALAAGGTVSVAALFAAGIVPGLVFGTALMATAWWTLRGSGAGAGLGVLERPAVGRALGRAALSLSLIGVVLGGILGGVFTATEAAAVAVVYAGTLTLGVYREVRWRELAGILVQAGMTTGVVFLLIATSMAMSWILALEDVPARASAWLLGMAGSPVLVLLGMNLLLLAVGTFMDMTPAVLIFTPILGPVAAELGMDPVHFGIMLIANLCIGLCTPPVGTCLFVGCGVGGVTLGRASRAAVPFVGALGLALLAITYVPGLSLWLPGVLGMR